MTGRKSITREADRIRDRLRVVDRHLEQRDGGRGFLGPMPEDDMMPADILLEEVRRTAGIVRWIESKMAAWPDELVELSETRVDDKGGLHSHPTEAALWYAVYHRERQHLARVAKLTVDAGVEERRVRLAEQEADAMMRILDATFEKLGLTDDQWGKVPVIIGEVVKEIRELQ